MSYPGIAGKVAIVTGSGGGIGEAYARALVREGAKVVIAEIDEQKGGAVADSIKADGGDATFVAVDVSSEASTKSMATAAIETYGGIDFLVNNAALFGGMKMESMLTVDWSYYKKFMDINMDGALLCSRACYRSMKERGGGAIVNQSSTAAWMVHRPSPESETRPSKPSSWGSSLSAAAVRSRSQDATTLPRRHTSVTSGISMSYW